MIILSAMAQESMNYFLKTLSGKNPGKLILLVCEGAPNHQESAIEIPSNIIIEKYLLDHCKLTLLKVCGKR